MREPNARASIRGRRWSFRRRASRAGSGSFPCTITSPALASSPRWRGCSRTGATITRRFTRRKWTPSRRQGTACAGKRVAPFRTTKDYSYRASKAAGDGWVLVGDAYGFLDPLYSSGVLLALKSGSLAADAVVEGLAKGDTSEAQLGSERRTTTSAWIGCGGWCANIMMASTSGGCVQVSAFEGAPDRFADWRSVRGQGGRCD